MSQLDLSIFFYNMLGLIMCFYIIIHLVSQILTKFLYNKKVRNFRSDGTKYKTSSNNINTIKRILKN
nr:ATP synthase F0 subunit 8 [Physalia sp.]